MPDMLTSLKRCLVEPRQHYNFDSFAVLQLVAVAFLMWADGVALGSNKNEMRNY
jgi:hypothetical protein